MTRLKAFSLGEFGPNRKRVEMSANQINAAGLFLRKVLPDLASQQLIIDPPQAKSTEQIKAEIRALIEANPELIKLVSAPSPALSGHVPVTIEGETIKNAPDQIKEPTNQIPTATVAE
jgi:hypothetical protein